jgi:hypothetical protein
MVTTRRGIDAVHKDARERNRLAFARNGYCAIKWNVLAKLVYQYRKVAHEMRVSRGPVRSVALPTTQAAPAVQLKRLAAMRLGALEDAERRKRQATRHERNKEAAVQEGDVGGP